MFNIYSHLQFGVDMLKLVVARLPFFFHDEGSEYVKRFGESAYETPRYWQVL